MKHSLAKVRDSITVKLAFAIVSLFILLFQDVLDNRLSLSLFGYYDELLAVVGLVYLLYCSVSHRLSRKINMMLICLFGALFIGAISTLLSDVSTRSIWTLVGAFSYLKIYVIFGAATVYLRNFVEHARIVRLVSNVCLPFVVIGLIFGFLNLVVDVGMYTDMRYGFRAFNFVFSRVGGLYTFCSLIVVIFFLDANLNKKRLLPTVGIICSMLLMLLTLRSRAIAFVIAFVFLYFFQYRRKDGRIHPIALLILGGLIVFIGFDQIYYYFFEVSTRARSALLQYGFVTCQDYFPLGAGFATYGTYWANVVSTPLYSRYGFDLIYGLGHVNSSFAADNSWPAVIGELGIFGFFLFAAAIFFCFSEAWRRCRDLKATRFLCMYLIICFFVGTTASSTVFTSACIMFELAFLATLRSDSSINQDDLNEKTEVKMTSPMIIGACGFNATGSSAVVDYLKEFDENIVVDQFEFTIAHMPDGLQDLKHHLNEGSKHTSSCMALDRFQRLAKGYPSRVFNKFCKNKLPEFAEEFLDSISQCELMGHSIVSSYYDPLRDRFARVLRRCKLARYYRKAEEYAGKDLPLFPYSVRRYSFKPSNYDAAARRFVGRMLAELGMVAEKNMVLDQPFAGNNPQAAFPFFENPVAIVVDRDPRDYYLLNKKFYYPLGWRGVPCNNVENFVTYFRSMRENMPYLKNDSRILRIRFEDMIYEYEETTKRIKEFCHLEKHVTPYKYFDPKKSIHNTNLSSLYPDLADDVAFIERALPEYLYPFERYENMSLDGERRFFL